MSQEYIIGIDLGTTNIKAGLFTQDGELLTEGSYSFSINRPCPGAAEQDPDEWWSALQDVIKQVVTFKSDIRVKALAFCSQVNSHVYTDIDGNAVMPVMLWQDLRPLKYVDELNARVQMEPKLYPEHYLVDETALVARAEWLKRDKPELWEKTAYIFSPKDYLNMRLTGVAAADALASIGMVTDDCSAYLPYMDHLVPGTGKRLPPLVPFREKIGKVKKLNDEVLDYALEDTIVAEGTMDVFGNLYGSGAVEAGDAIEVTGTCEIMGSLSTTSKSGTGICYFPKLDGLYFHSAPTKSGGRSQMWLCDLLNIDIHEFVELAEKSVPGARGLIFLPYLEGERGPIWDGSATGVFFGLTGSHTREDLCRAVIEGVSFSGRHIIEEADIASGYRASCLRVSGGSSQSDICCQIRADILNRRLDRIQVTNSGMLGAALMASVAGGINENMAEAAKRLVHVEKSFMPNPENIELYDKQFEIYKKLYLQLKECYAMAMAIR